MNQHYPPEQISFLQAVKDMRDAQRDYFNQPNGYRLKVSKLKEQKVDCLLQPYLNAGLITAKQPEPTKQISLLL